MAFHYKKDGSLDMRYSSSRAAMGSGFGASSFGYSGGSNYSAMSSGPSFSSGLHYKRDGDLDMRYSSSKAAVASPFCQQNYMNQPPSSSQLHHKKDGTLDMRYSSSKAAVAFPFSQQSHMNQPPSSSQLHHKKDGTLDMRYSSSKMASAATPSVQSNHMNRPPSSSQLHYKKDRSLDMRYNSSKVATSSMQTHQMDRPSSSSQLHYKKDGTLDMRYTSSRSTMNSNHGIPPHIPVTKAGIPDMRTKDGKEWVKEQAQKRTNDIPSWLPKTKDGSLDISKPITQEYLKEQNNSPTNYAPDQRLAYYCQKLEDMLFRQLVENARQDDVEMPEYEMLPDTQDIQRQLCCQPTRNTAIQDNDDDDYYDAITPERQYQSRQSSSRPMKSFMRHDDNEYDIRNEVSESVLIINYKDLHINTDDELGRGSFGIVYKATWNGDTVAVKQLHLNKLTRPEKKSFVKEIKIMSTLGKHPNLVSLYGYTLEPLCLVMEYVELGSLNYLLHYCEDPQIEAKITDGRIKKKLILGIALGMMQLHRVNIVHGDLKPQNVLVSRDYTAKVTDFGFATLRGKTTSSMASSVTVDENVAIGGTAAYMGPELLDSSKPPECSSDIYSFGIMLNEVIQEEEPYSDQYQNFRGRGPFGAVNHARLGNRPRIGARTPSFLKTLIEKCWHRDPRYRPTFEQIFNELKSSYIKFPDSFDL